MATLGELKKEVFDYARFMLGDQMVDVELDPQHYETALKQSLSRYRQRAERSTEESFSFLELQADVNTYTLPQEVLTVKQLYRRGIGSASGGAGTNTIEPFEAGYMNMYMLQPGRLGGLLTYELFAQYQELSARMFGGYLNYTFNPVSKVLQLMKRPRADAETIMLHTHNFKPDLVILSDFMIQPWMKDYTLGLCKIMLGEAREKFSTIAGPQGGTTLNGASLKAEGQATIERLEEELKNYIDGSTPLSFVIG